MKIPVALPYLDEKDAQQAYDTILTNWVTQGPKVLAFEDQFTKITESKHAIAVSSCTTALHLAMIMADIKNGDEVICPSMSYIATANSIRYAGGTPVFAEVNEQYNLDPQDVVKRITSKTKAILLVHQLGMPAQIEEFQKICKEHNLILIEDAACAIGSKYYDKPIGSHSDLVCFSFHPRKVITTGDGGMITTSREDFSDRLRVLRQHGMSINDRVRHNSKTVIIEEYLELGYNYRLTDIQAAIGIEQLNKLDYILEERRKIAHLYHKELSGISALRLPIEPEGCYSNYQSYSIYLKPEAQLDRNEIMQNLLDVGISTRRGVMTAHRAKAYDQYVAALPVSEDLEDNSIIIPLYVGMTEDQIGYVMDHLKKFIR